MNSEDNDWPLRLNPRALNGLSDHIFHSDAGKSCFILTSSLHFKCNFHFVLAASVFFSRFSMFNVQERMQGISYTMNHLCLSHYTQDLSELQYNCFT